MSDPTMELLDKFKDKSQWASVKENVPIFMEHEAWEVPDARGNLQFLMVYDESERPTAKGARFLYRIGKEEMESGAEAINRNLEYGKPIKMLSGHTLRDKAGRALPQAEQPPLLGYGVGARVGRWGPKKKWGILTDQFTPHGFIDLPSSNGHHYQRSILSLVKELPERSPEYYPGRNEITAVALLKTDPRLPMGMIAYEANREMVVNYQKGFPMPDMYADKPDTGKIPPGDTDPTDPEPNADAGYTPEEQGMMDKFVNYLKSKFPALASIMDGQIAGAADAPAMPGAPPAGGPPGAPPMPAPPPNPQMQQYAREVADLKKQVVNADLERIFTKLDVAGVNYSREEEEPEFRKREKPEDRVKYAERILRHYSRRDGSPADNDPGWMDTLGGVEGGRGEEDITPELNEKLVHYAESKGLDLRDDEDWQEAMQAVKARGKK